MMKIFHANIALVGGGLEQYLFQLFHELDLRGHQNILLYGQRGENPSTSTMARPFYIEGVTKTHCIDLERKLMLVKETVEKENPDLVLIHQVLNPSLVNLLTKMKPSLRFVHGFKLICPDGRKMLKAKRKICPFPLSYHCQWRAYVYRCMPRNPLVGLPQIYRSKKMTWLHKRRSRMIVTSKFMKSILLYNGFEEKRIEHIPLFTYLPERQNAIPSNDEPVILGVGRIVTEKGMDYLIRAFAKIGHRAKLIIIGEGPALESLKSLAQELEVSDRISFPGWLPHDKLAAFYRQCAVVVVPSVAPESFGMVGIEAMSYAKPVLTFDVGGISDWLQHGETGFLVPPRDELSLTEKMNLLLESPGLAEEMGRKGRSIAEQKFSPHRHVERLISVFDEEIEAFRERHEIH